MDITELPPSKYHPQPGSSPCILPGSYRKDCSPHLATTPPVREPWREYRAEKPRQGAKPSMRGILGRLSPRGMAFTVKGALANPGPRMLRAVMRCDLQRAKQTLGPAQLPSRVGEFQLGGVHTVSSMEGMALGLSIAPCRLAAALRSTYPHSVPRHPCLALGSSTWSLPAPVAASPSGLVSPPGSGGCWPHLTLWRHGLHCSTSPCCP